MTDQWIAHVKATQKFYKDQGTPISYHQALFAARKSYAEVKAGNQPKFEVEPVPPHNTKPREKKEVKSKVEYEEKGYIPNRRPPPAKRDEYEVEDDYSYGYQDYEYEPPYRVPPRRGRPISRDEYDYSRDEYEYERREPPIRGRGRGRLVGRGRPPVGSDYDRY